MTARHNLSSIQKGASLIELIITIVLISIALTGILNVMNQTTKHSADPVVQQQAISIAESYLEEITLLPFIDPDGTNVGETRATFDNIDDYNGLSDAGAYNQINAAIVGLDNYNVDVSITDVTITAVHMKVITVAVSTSSVGTITLTAYRADY
jgi:MSHA pilin protein MshD